MEEQNRKNTNHEYLPTVIPLTISSSENLNRLLSSLLQYSSLFLCWVMSLCCGCFPMSTVCWSQCFRHSALNLVQEASTFTDFSIHDVNHCGTCCFHDECCPPACNHPQNGCAETPRNHCNVPLVPESLLSEVVWRISENFPKTWTQEEPAERMRT
uniref:Uncharacterized protein n=1 Tax=Anguilla anguilla TaxID=7936 RepID=A0A0E9WUK9_ANGAN